MSRGDGSDLVFLDQTDYKRFLKITATTVDKYNLNVYAYCLMSNHYHMLIQTPESNISRSIKYLNGVYTQMFNRRHKRMGHVFQGRFKSILVEEETYLLTLASYIVRNPVRAGISKEPKDYTWSSYVDTAIKKREHSSFLAEDLLLKNFAENKQKARRRYIDFINGFDDGDAKELLTQGNVLGTERFIDSIKESFWEIDEIEEIPRVQRYVDRPPLSSLFGSTLNAEKKDKVKRDILIHDAVYDFGYSQKEVADFLGLHYSTLSRIVTEMRK
jgi:REP element-mobilizing transposase RayT